MSRIYCTIRAPAGLQRITCLCLFSKENPSGYCLQRGIQAGTASLWLRLQGDIVQCLCRVVKNNLTVPQPGRHLVLIIQICIKASSNLGFCTEPFVSRRTVLRIRRACGWRGFAAFETPHCNTCSVETRLYPSNLRAKSPRLVNRRTSCVASKFSMHSRMGLFTEGRLV